MPRCRWILALVGAGMNLGILTGCLFLGAEKTDSPTVTHTFQPKDTITPAVPPPDKPLPEPDPIEPPKPPPEPVPTSAINTAEPLPRSSEPAPPSQPPQPPPDTPLIDALRVCLADKPDYEKVRQIFSQLGKTDADVLAALLPVVKSAGRGELARGAEGDRSTSEPTRNAQRHVAARLAHAQQGVLHSEYRWVRRLRATV